MLTHKTLGGFETTPDERADAFVSVSSNIIFAGAGKAVGVIDVEGEGALQRANDFSTKTKGEFKTTELETHQQARAKAFRINEENLKASEDVDATLDILDKTGAVIDKLENMKKDDDE